METYTYSTQSVLAAVIGDPTVAGWVIFSGYFAVAMICARAFRVALIGSRMAAVYPQPEDRRAKDRTAAYRASLLFWGMVIALFIFLGINKQIDLQTWITDVGRRMAMEQGWYERRGEVQTLFVLSIAISGLAMLAILLKLTRDLLPRHVLAFFGLSLLALFLLAAASSFHDLEAALATEILGVRISWMLELTGIGCVGACAIVNDWWHRAGPKARRHEGT